ncbi:MAG: HAMP domain-containing sensor histidine kinase [Gammaproteobacteria bacterium]|nr:HAMP domain-containing sensor histidine kinase [Gammaproteobacteria bacterium]
MSEKGLFETVLASTVHDMKNSLSLLLGQLDVISEKLEQDQENQQAVSTLRYEAGRINYSLMELLTLYRLEKQQLGMNISEVIVADFIDDCVAGHSMMARNNGIRLEATCDDELIWFFDPDLVGIAINNILGNSIRYSHERVQISVQILDKQLLIQIDDDGNGYPQKLLDEVENFSTGVNAQTGSTGLGLYFAATIANCHQRQERQGRIQLANGAGLPGGSFQLHLP